MLFWELFCAIGAMRLGGVFDLEILPGGGNEFDVDILLSLFANSFKISKIRFGCSYLFEPVLYDTLFDTLFGGVYELVSI